MTLCCGEHASNTSYYSKVRHCLSLVRQGSTHLTKKQSAFNTILGSLYAYITSELVSVVPSIAIKHDKEVLITYPAAVIHQ